MNWTTTFLTQHVGWIDPEMPDKPIGDYIGGLVPVSYTHLTLPTTPYV